MQNNRRLYWIVQLGGWSSYGVLLFLATYAQRPEIDLFKLTGSISLFLLIGMLTTHTLRILVIRMGFLNLKLAPLIPRIIFLSLLGAILMAYINHFVSVYIENDDKKILHSLGFLIDILSLWLLFMLWNAIYFTYHFFRKTMKQELHVVQMQASQNEIELKSLRSQINPHFLFNSLNSIRALIDIDPPTAKDCVTTLSNLLRKSLVHGKSSFIKLEEEIELVNAYLNLEKVRFEERLRIEWEVQPGLESYQIPPFLLHTQVENAIKHGISKLIEGGKIHIKISHRDQESLILEISNSGRIERGNSDTGIGIENTLRRLDLQYRGKASFALREANGLVICTITINE